MTTTTPAEHRPTPRYLRVSETAKLIRAALKPAFPGIRFSVRSSSYAGGASVRIEWTDGPTTRAVDDVVNAYAGAGFDGMIDLKYGKSTWLCATHGARRAEVYGHGAGLDGPAESRCCAAAELVHMGADYVHTVRSWSPAVRAVLEEMVARRYGFDAYDPNARVGDRNGVGGEWLSHMFHRETFGVTIAADPATGDPVVVNPDRGRPAIRPAR